MKRIVVSLSAFLILGLQATDINTNMHTMKEEGLVSIQDGFLYNSQEAVAEGIVKIKEANKIFHDKDSVAKYLPKDKKKLVGVTLLSANRLNSDLDAMSEYLAQGNMLEAAVLHSDIIKDCTRCHAIVRGW